MISYQHMYYKLVYLLGKSVKDVGIVIANVEDTNSLNAMALKGKAILNCVGPYR